jgi:hypothetical protein
MHNEIMNIILLVNKSHTEFNYMNIILKNIWLTFQCADGPSDSINFRESDYLSDYLLLKNNLASWK